MKIRRGIIRTDFFSFADVGMVGVKCGCRYETAKRRTIFLLFSFLGIFACFSECCFFRVVFRFFWSSEFSFPIEFDSKGFHPGCKCKGNERDEGPTAEPKPKSRKSKHRSILRQKNAPKSKNDTPEQQYLVITRSETSIWKGHEFFCSGASCIMLAVSTLR